MSKFKIGDYLIKKNADWGDTEPFIVRCIHVEDYRFGHGSEIRYSSGFYEYGYLEHDLAHFETYSDRDGIMRYRPVEKLTLWKRIKSKIVQWRFKFKRK